MGDATLSNGLLQIFYWRSYYDFLNNYSSYIAYIGLDTAKPLNEQTCGMSSTTMTWEQFFLDNALQTWAQYQAVRLDAEAAGYTISEGTQTQLNSSAQQLETSAQQYGFLTLYRPCWKPILAPASPPKLISPIWSCI